MKTASILMKQSRNPKAFTLVELLVVIAILIALAALAFTVASKARDSANAAIDTNDMRVIGSTVISYTADNNGLLPVTSGGVGPIYYEKNRNRSLVGALAPYLRDGQVRDGEYFSEFAAASWQSETLEESGPSLLVMHRVFSGLGKPENQSRPDPNVLPFGYPFPPGKRDPMTLTGAVAQMADPSICLMLTEIDKLHPNFRGSTPGWLDAVPEGMAHGDYRLGLYWDGHVSRLDIDLNPR